MSPDLMQNWYPHFFYSTKQTAYKGCKSMLFNFSEVVLPLNGIVNTIMKICWPSPYYTREKNLKIWTLWISYTSPNYTALGLWPVSGLLLGVGIICLAFFLPVFPLSPLSLSLFYFLLFLLFTFSVCYFCFSFSLLPLFSVFPIYSLICLEIF